MFSRAVTLSCIIFMISCSKEIKFTKVKARGVSQNQSLPVPLIEQLAKNFKKANPDLNLDEKKIFNKFGFYSKEVWPLSLMLWSDSAQDNNKHYEVFDESIRIDLNSYLSSINDVDEFYMQLKLKTQKFNKLYVYFIPSMKEVSSDCTKYYDISSFYLNNISEKVLVSKKNDHYIKNYLGTYVFFSPLTKDLYQLNVLKLTDTSVSDKLCKHF